MNQDPPVLIPYVDKDIYTDIPNNSVDPTFIQEPTLNGYLTNGNKSPTMPTLYEADNEPQSLFNVHDIFSALGKDEYTATEYLRSEPRNDSASLFEKIYKDYSTTLNSSSNPVTSSKDSINSQNELNVDYNIKSENNEDSYQQSQELNDQEKVLSALPEEKEECLTKVVVRKTRKRKIKRTVDPASDTEDFGKYGIKTVPKRRSEMRPATGTEPSRDLIDNKYLRSPFISLRHRTPKKMAPATSVISSSYEIVNPALRGNTEHHTAVYRPNLKALFTSQFSAITACVCAFCGLGPASMQLGSLYGPYYIDRDAVHTLPLTAIFPSAANEIGVSGQSAIKSDQHGNLKMVIQSTTRHSRRDSAVRKGQATVAETDDYRVTWDGEVWLHRECVLWAPGTYLRGDGKIGGLDEALKMALNAECFVCHKIGAILNCTTKNCEKNFHHYCAVLQESKMNCEQLSVLCNKHKAR